MLKKACVWFLDKSGGAAVGAGMTTVVEGVRGWVFGNPNAAAFLIGIAVSSTFAVLAVIMARGGGSRVSTGSISMSGATARGVLGDFVDIRLESADYGSDQYTRSAMDGLTRLIRDQNSVMPDGAISFGINSKMLIGDESFLPGVYKHLKVTFSAKLHESKELTFRPGDRVIKPQ
jgi:hypothetical protein